MTRHLDPDSVDTIAEPTLPPDGHEFWGLDQPTKDLYCAIVKIAESDAAVWLETITDEQERTDFAAHAWTAALLAIEMHGMGDAIHRLIGTGSYYGDRAWREMGESLDVVRPEAIRALTWYDSAVRLAFDRAVDGGPARRILARLARGSEAGQ